MFEAALIVIACIAACAICYWIGHSVGYSEGRQDGWLQYDSIVPDIKDECERLAAAPEPGPEKNDEKQ